MRTHNENNQTTADEKLESIKDYLGNDYKITTATAEALKNSKLSFGGFINEKDTFELINPDVAASIETSLSEGRTVLLAGAYRMGKSNTLKCIEDDLAIEHTILHGYSEENIAQVITEAKETHKPVLVDEFSRMLSEPEKIALLINAAKEDTPLLLDVALESLVNAGNMLRQNGIEFDVKIMEPLPEQQMQRYVKSVLNLDQDDKLVRLISRLSNGSVAIAQLILREFKISFSQTRVVNQPDTEQIISCLKSAAKDSKHVFDSWDQQESQLPDFLKGYVPKPALRKLG